MNFTTIIGLEVHVQLSTRTKIFCGCVNKFNPDQPNTQTCPVCLGLPGALPVINREAIRLGQMTGLALNCTITPLTKWDRKQYFYPDLPKGYQTSQFDLPLCQNGWIETFSADGEARRVRILRAHLEEDAGKNMHDESGRGRDSQVDLNRAGTPLLEIVSQPDIRSAQEAKAVLEELHLLLTYLGVSDCNMQEGSLRCDANVNLHIDTDGCAKVATPIVEVKNLNSFRSIEAAIEYEVKRQLEEFQKTGRKIGDPGVEKETRGWDMDRGFTFSQRGKEEAADYRYFPCPDLVPVTTSPERIEELRKSLPEFPALRRARYRNEYGLSLYDASVIVNQGADLARYFETVVSLCGDAKQAANWVTQDVQRDLNDRKLAIGEFPISGELLGSLLKRIVGGDLTVKGAREVYAQLLADSDEDQSLSVDRIDAIIEEKGLKVVNDTGLLDAAIASALAESQKAIDDYKAGKQQALGAVVGKVMKLVKGADAKVVREMLIRKIVS
jgi:aspartyl-tRNA(Asn)/glutamyl-tRNA(Gln) amidotransferase subunit B